MFIFCPYCSADITNTGLQDPARTPKAGDFVLCCYCGEPLEFTGKGEKIGGVKATTWEALGKRVPVDNYTAVRVMSKQIKAGKFGGLIHYN